MAGKKKQKQQAKKAAATSAQVVKAVAESKSAQGQVQNLKREMKALAVDARFNANVNKTNAKQMRRVLVAYLKVLTNPVRENACRVPDGFPRRTALLHSLQTVSVMPNNNSDTTASDKGRFFFSVSPTIAGSGFVRTALNIATLQATAGTVAGPVAYNKFSQGCKVAYLSPDAEWDPATSFQVLTPAPKSIKTEKVKPSVGPPIPSNTQWKFLADPNATAIAGSIIPENPALFWEGGAAEAIRPVAMSVLLQRDASDMLNGGECAIALMPPKSLAGNVVPFNWDDATAGTANWGGQGPVANVENLAQVPGAYSGPLRNGAYAIWVPHGYEDYDMNDLVDHVIADFPWIAVAGKAQTYDQGEVARLVINTVWEYTTVDQTRETKMGEYDPEMYALIKHIMRTQPTAMQNDEHTAWWKHLLKIAASAGIGLLSGGPVGAVAGASGYIMGQL